MRAPVSSSAPWSAGSVSQRSSQSSDGQPPEARTGRPVPARRSEVRRPANPKQTRRTRLNFEGAFPLLLVGSALLCYAAILANQEIASKGTHLPLWGLFGAVGSVIAGAGIYSTFFVPSEVPPLDLSKQWVTVPKAEWEALHAPPAQRSGTPPVVARPAVRPSSSRTATPRPAWEEDWDPDSDAFRAAASPPAPADFVLRQIEDLEKSLRKKPSTAPKTRSQG